MEWVKFFELISVICWLGALVQVLRFSKELRNIDKDQELTDEWAKRWKRLLYWVVVLVVSGSIFSGAALILRYMIG
ncbi:hypothetical protein F7731_26090 [Cytobacillus depressus]|uniref:Uncharacterized protein n=1 Tax=Cytobacillus depressus TaxID=1602942 RepID=A0A6L3UWK8_9BACI|nr:hypothetical protein [Cytobacillus depressus]KAB2328085.1 hypothetical protein F7731_26090 [Cytobacillus depressus]